MIKKVNSPMIFWMGREDPYGLKSLNSWHAVSALFAPNGSKFDQKLCELAVNNSVTCKVP